MKWSILMGNGGYCHNPYFNRWFSAITAIHCPEAIKGQSQSLF